MTTTEIMGLDLALLSGTRDLIQYERLRYHLET
jgi:hypothetical protein